MIDVKWEIKNTRKYTKINYYRIFEKTKQIKEQPVFWKPLIEISMQKCNLGNKKFMEKILKFK